MDKYITGKVFFAVEENLIVTIDSFSCSVKLDKDITEELIDNINKTMTGEIIEDKTIVLEGISIIIVPDVYPDRSTWQFIRDDQPGKRGVIFAEDIVRLKKELAKY